MSIRNVEPMIARLTQRPDGGVDPQMFIALHTPNLSLDRALDLVEIDQWSQSWRAAAQWNSEEIGKILAERNGNNR